jgi:hypothetical protein
MAVHVVATPWDKAAVNTAIGNANADATAWGIEAAPDTVLRFPSRVYPVTGPLTAARGNYSIIMDPGAYFLYTPTSVPGTVNEKMWTIGSISPGGTTGRTIDGQGVLQFDLAAEQTGAGLTPFTDAFPNNLPFEFINISHYWLTIRRASGFHSALRMRAQGVGGEYRYMYDVTVNLGYLHSSFRHLVQVTAADGWMNNIRYYNGNFAPAVEGARYVNMMTEAGGGENKAVMWKPLFDSTRFTAVYAQGGSVEVYGGHVENPQEHGAYPAGGVIEHPVGAVFADPSIVISPRLESKILMVKDPVDFGSYAHDPFWGASQAPRPKIIPASPVNYTITAGDLRRQSKLQTAVGEAAARSITMPTFGSESPPVTTTVYVKRSPCSKAQASTSSCPAVARTTRSPCGRRARKLCSISKMRARLTSGR